MITDILTGGVTNLIGKVIDKVFPDPKQAAEAKALLLSMDLSSDIEQIKVNIEEAKSESLFKSGWRPFVGWVCGVAFAYKFIIMPFLMFLITLVGWHVPLNSLPVLDWTELSAVLFGMLGLGYYRTREKMNKVN